jgi:hypothetical protein
MVSTPPFAAALRTATFAAIAMAHAPLAPTRQLIDPDVLPTTITDLDN